MTPDLKQALDAAWKASAVKHGPEAIAKQAALVAEETEKLAAMRRAYSAITEEQPQ